MQRDENPGRKHFMRSIRIATTVLAALIVLPMLYAQDKPAQEPPPAPISLKIQVLLTEYAGTQKVSSLPYTLYTLAAPPFGPRRAAQLRIGVDVPMSPVPTDHWYNVGTNLDCQATQVADGKVSLEFTIERTSLATRGSNGEEVEWKAGEGTSDIRLERKFRDSFILMMRDGQTMEGTSAVDPVSGHILKIEVTLAVLK
jgi:hypothetical protein